METGGKYLFPLDPMALHHTTTGRPTETARAAISGQVSSEEKGQSEEPLRESDAVTQPGAGQF